ncbi:Plastid lipid-associated protein/fibrillin conserved domain-containing protein [Artemisia annua]|uniref:Plastid lipid-associated protein/fibrillin conserved domain-containing protein n=1 Tax=Artemisia annua TaxID=35608 RepID=A0A2U1KDF3_ARTAN|nr:Plastid lipid-associated protein/fibrillin conserved domain-containing protein [Artemisia annua]
MVVLIHNEILVHIWWPSSRPTSEGQDHITWKNGASSSLQNIYEVIEINPRTIHLLNYAHNKTTRGHPISMHLCCSLEINPRTLPTLPQGTDHDILGGTNTNIEVAHLLSISLEQLYRWWPRRPSWRLEILARNAKVVWSLSLAKTNLLNLISDQNRGLKTQDDPKRLAEIGVAIESIALMNRDQVTTNSLLSGTWRLLWTTEKEQLFIIKNADFFGTEAGDVLQVIDVENKSLNNVITFPPDGVFFVRSGIEIASDQRVNFRFTSAVLRGKDWEFPLPPFGKGWFDSVYLDNDIRIAKDIRGDYLVVDRAPYQWKE